jgi:hypothetical protein
MCEIILLLPKMTDAVAAAKINKKSQREKSEKWAV